MPASAFEAITLQAAPHFQRFYQILRGGRGDVRIFVEN